MYAYYTYACVYVCVCVCECRDTGSAAVEIAGKGRGCSPRFRQEFPRGVYVCRRLFFSSLRSLRARKRKLLVNLPFMSREMQFGSSPRIYPSLLLIPNRLPSTVALQTLPYLLPEHHFSTCPPVSSTVPLTLV